MYNSITLKQCADLIAAVGDKQTVLVQGEMGIGKSAILKMLKSYPQFKDAYFCYVDITTKDVGDFIVPKIRDIDGNEVCSFIPNEEFGFHFKGKKVVMMLDEIGKARGGVMNACLRLMNERGLGVDQLTEGSVVFGTTNLVCRGTG
jgi:MoxR-like ATPase